MMACGHSERRNWWNRCVRFIPLRRIMSSSLLLCWQSTSIISVRCKRTHAPHATGACRQPPPPAAAMPHAALCHMRAVQAPEVRALLLRLRDLQRAAEGAPQPPDLLALQRLQSLSDLGVQGAVGALAKAAADAAAAAAGRV